jgi:hypothetical protein
MRKFFPKAFFYAAIVVLTSLAAYTVIFASQVRCLFVEWSELEEIAPGVYVEPSMIGSDRAMLLAEIAESRIRLAAFFQKTKSVPIIIAGESERIMAQYGAPLGTPGMNHTTLFGSYIVLGAEGLNVDVISHELCHAELFARVGWYNRQTKIPTWFDEGLALILDYRYAQSDAMWLMITHHGKRAPSLEQLANMHDFMQYTAESPYLSYVTSMREVQAWWDVVGLEGFEEFTQLLREGSAFQDAYKGVLEEKRKK